MKTWEVLERAADVMAVRGRTTMTWIERDGGPCCLVGAVYIAATGNEDGAGVLRWKNNGHPALDALEPIIGGPYQSMFNLKHSQEQVIATLRAAAATEKAREARLLPVVVEKVTA